MSFSINPEDRLGGELRKSPPRVKKRKSPPPPRPPRGGKKGQFWSWLLKWSLILLIWGAFVGGCLLLWYSYDLPDISKLQQTERRPSITVLAKDGTKLATYGDLHGQMVTTKKLPPYVMQALLAIEDHRFYSHFGVDVFGLFRAIYTNLRAGHVVQGGSTITQQLAKNFLQSEKLYDTNDRSLRRKIQEAILALWLERNFSKDQILTMYLNRVYFGSGTFGLAAASQHYFGKRPKDLTLYEAALIVGLLKAPSKYSPSTNPDLADQRASQVLENMQGEGFIAEDVKDASLAMASSASETFQGSAIRYFTDWIVDLLPTVVNIDDKDIIVTTTLDPQLQSLAEIKLDQVMEEKGRAAQVSEMALVSMTHDGAIRALLGGVNYKHSQFSRATQALRQPGSAFKIVLYLAALESGIHPGDYVSDLPIQIGKWKPKNYKYQTRGEIPLQDAMAYSVNTVSVRLAHRLGVKRIKETAQRLGLTSSLPDDLTIVLGTGETTLLELTSAYAVIARNGWSVSPHAILTVKDTLGHTLYSHKEVEPHRIVDPYVAQELTQMMQAVMTYGTGKNSALGRPSAGKTGTSQKHRDAWLLGFTPELVTGVWAGNDGNAPMNPNAGSPAARLWHLYMREVPFRKASFHKEVPQNEEEESHGFLEDLIGSLF